MGRWKIGRARWTVRTPTGKKQIEIPESSSCATNKAYLSFVENAKCDGKLWSCGRKDAAGGSRCCALGVQSRPCAGDGEGVSGKSLLCLGPSILVTVTWACWSSGIPKAFGNGISIRFKGRCLARFRRLLLEEVSTKSCLTYGVTELNWLKAMRLLRKKGRLTCIAKEPHNFICSFLSTSKNTPVPFPFHGSVHFTSSEGTTDVPSLNRNVRIRFVV